MGFNALTAAATIINFIILVFVLRRFLYKPVTAIISSRETEIKERINKSEEDLKKAEMIRIENEEKLKNAYEEGKSIVEASKSKAQTVSDGIISKAKEEAEFIIERARKDAERERDKAEDEIKAQAINLAILLSSKALEKELNEEEHRRLIDDFITKVGV